MRVKKINVLVATLSMGLSIGIAAAFQVEPGTDKPALSHINFIKPGASVSVETDYDNETRPGDLETISLTLHHLYTDGVVSVKLLPSPGLEIIFANPPSRTTLTQGFSPEFSVQFSTLDTGTYSLGFEIIYEDRLDNQSRRTVSVPIRVGTTPNEKTILSKATAQKTPSSGIIALSAQEVIR